MDMMPIFDRESTPMAMTASLSMVGQSHTLRCDAKQAERRFNDFEVFMSSVPHFELGWYLPQPFVKGKQPKYIESLDAEGVPVISTIAIHDLSIDVELCRLISYEDYDALDEEQRLRPGDVLLTMDGGTSIGKPVVFDLEDEYVVDTHVAILRPRGLDPKLLVYLLASPLGQLQFQRAESGASGQTAVTEGDVRRFRFTVLDDKTLASITAELERSLSDATQLALAAWRKRERAWLDFHEALTGGETVVAQSGERNG